MAEENKKKLTPKIQTEIIDKLVFKPVSFDFRNELQLQDKSSYNPYLELNFFGKTELACYFKKQLTPEGTLGLDTLKTFDLTDFHVEPDHDELHFREYEYESENRIAVRYHYTLKDKNKKSAKKEMDIFVCFDWGKDAPSKTLRTDFFFLMKNEGDALLSPKYTPTVIEFVNYMFNTLNVKNVCDTCIHRFQYDLTGGCAKVFEEQL